ncbi:MAG: YciI family protein [Candidatus Korobacteraceae bacterium]
MKYIWMGYYEPAKHAVMTGDEKNAMFDECFEFDDHLRANGHWISGEAIQPAETALILGWKNGKVTTTDGPYAETKEQLGGIGVLEARDMNHAVQLLSQHPALKYGARFEIRPTLDMSDLMRQVDQRRRQGAAR